MNIFKTDRFKESLKSVNTDRWKEGLKSLTDPIKNLAHNAKSALARRESQKDKHTDIVEIFPRIYWMIFPRPEKIRELSECIKTKFQGKYYIWNVSEYQYETESFDNKVSNHVFVGYPCPPFLEIMKICKSVIEWLNKDQENIAIIHCQSTKCRSAVVTSCLLSLLKVVNHPMEALTYFCNKLKLDDTSFLYPSQHQTIKNFANVMDKIQLNKKSFVLEKIIINEVPKLKEEKDKKAAKNNENKSEGFRPYIQIFKDSKAIFNYLSKEKPKVYYPTDIAIWFEIGIEVKDDLLIRCRHYKNDTERTSVFRVFFNPCFAFDEVVRLNKTEVDFLPDVETTEDFLIDLIIKPTENVENNEAENIKKLREECEKLTEEYIQKKQEYDQQEELRKEQERLEHLQNTTLEDQEKSGENKQGNTSENKNVNLVEADTKAKFVIDDNIGDDEEEKEDETLKETKEINVEIKTETKKEAEEKIKTPEIQSPIMKSHSLAKSPGNDVEDDGVDDKDDNLEDDDLDDYIRKLESKNS